MISGTHQRVLWLGLWLISFLVVIGTLCILAALEVRKVMYEEATQNIAGVERVRGNVDARKIQYARRLARRHSALCE
ncbi:MAG: hypothetical protein WDN31_01025 [Hyphomicrobium sp.]